MKKHLFLAALLHTCLVWKTVAQEKDTSLPLIGLRASYAAGTNPYLQARIDSVLLATAARFNAGPRAFQLAEHTLPGQPCITIDFKKAKLATRRQRTVAYVVNVVAPVYLPAHKIKSTVTFSTPSGEAAVHENVLKSQTRVLLANISRREEKLLLKYADKLYAELLAIEATFTPAMSASGK